MVAIGGARPKKLVAPFMYIVHSHIFIQNFESAYGETNKFSVLTHRQACRATGR